MLHDPIVVILTLVLTYLLLRTFAAVSPEYSQAFLAKIGLIPKPPTT